MASGNSIERPAATLTMADRAYGVAGLQLSYGAGRMARADLRLVPGGGARVFRFGDLVKALEDADGLDDLAGTLEVSGGGDLLLAGYLTPPSLSAGRGSAPGYGVGLAHADARVSALNMAIYELRDSFFNAGDPDKNTLAVKGWNSARTYPEMLATVVAAMRSGFRERGPDENTERIRRNVHGNNAPLLPVLERFLGTLSLGEYDWGSRLFAQDAATLAGFVHGVLVREDRNFLSNISTLCDLSGLLWFSNPEPDKGIEGKSILALNDLVEGGVAEELEYAPVHVARQEPRYGTAAGLKPTNTVLVAKARDSFFSQGVRLPNPVWGMWPENLEDGAVLNRVSVPPWMPDNSGYRIGGRPGTQPVSAAAAAAGTAYRARDRETRLEAVQAVCTDWARTKHVAATSLQRSLTAQFPLMLDTRAGQVYSYMGSDGEFVKGLAWNVSHEIHPEGRKASTTIEFRMV